MSLARVVKVFQPIESSQFTLRAVFYSISLYNMGFCLESQSRSDSVDAEGEAG
jgi:hypothetical protein